MNNDIQYRCVPAVSRDGWRGYVIEERRFFDGEFWTDWEPITEILNAETANDCIGHLRGRAAP